MVSSGSATNAGRLFVRVLVSIHDRAARILDAPGVDPELVGRLPWELIDDEPARRQVRAEFAHALAFAEPRAYLFHGAIGGHACSYAVRLTPIRLDAARVIATCWPLSLEFSQLTARQRDVLGRLAGGATIKQVAAQLRLSVSTVETHAARAREALGLGSWPELLAHVPGWANGTDHAA